MHEEKYLLIVQFFLFGAKVNNTLKYADNHSLLNYNELNELILLQLFLT